MKTWRRAKNTYEIQWQDPENDDQRLGMTEKEGGACTRHLVDTPSKEKKMLIDFQPIVSYSSVQSIQGILSESEMNGLDT